jgi:hypothetical protein
LLGFGTGLELDSELEVGFEFGSGSELPLTTGSALKVGSGIGLELSLGVGIGQNSESSSFLPLSRKIVDFRVGEPSLHFLQFGIPVVEFKGENPLGQQSKKGLPLNFPWASDSPLSLIAGYF